MAKRTQEDVQREAGSSLRLPKLISEYARSHPRVLSPVQATGIDCDLFRGRSSKSTKNRGEQSLDGSRQGHRHPVYSFSELQVQSLTPLKTVPFDHKVIVAARSLARPSVRPQLALAGALSLELSHERLPNPCVRFATMVSDSSIDWAFTNWTETFVGCTYS